MAVAVASTVLPIPWILYTPYTLPPLNTLSPRYPLGITYSQGILYLRQMPYPQILHNQEGTWYQDYPTLKRDLVPTPAPLPAPEGTWDQEPGRNIGPYLSTVASPPPVNSMTDASENITFLAVVINFVKPN